MFTFMRVLAYIILIPLFFIKVIGKKNLKVDGGSVIISHHTSNWDPIILGFIVKHKPVCYMAKEELYKNPIAKWFLLSLHTIPLARHKGDIQAIKAALQALKAGKMLGIFPEGTRSATGEILNFQQGAALLALRGKAPVIPVYIKGNYKPFRQIKVFVDEPIMLTDYVGEKISGEAIKKATRILQDKITEMSLRD